MIFFQWCFGFNTIHFPPCLSFCDNTSPPIFASLPRLSVILGLCRDSLRSLASFEDYCPRKMASCEDCPRHANRILCTQQRVRPACAPVRSYQRICYSHASSMVTEAMQALSIFSQFYIGVGRGGGGGFGQGGQAPTIILEGANIPFAPPPPPPNNPQTCTGKTITLNSILEFSIISYFKMRNVIIWH